MGGLRTWVALLALAWGVGAGAAPPRADPARVVATFSILGDLVRQVGGERGAGSGLVGPNGDAPRHVPAPADAKTLAASRLVVVNGLGFEGWIDRLVKASGTRAAVVVASAGVTPIEEEPGGGHRDHAVDPHAWQSVANVKRYVASIRDGLSGID